MASVWVLDVGIVTIGLGEPASDARNDLRDTAFVEVVNVGNFLMGVVFEDDFLEDREIASAVFGMAGKDLSFWLGNDGSLVVGHGSGPD